MRLTILFKVKPNGTEACTNNITGHCVWGDHLRYTQGEAIGGVDQEEHLYMNEGMYIGF